MGQHKPPRNQQAEQLLLTPEQAATVLHLGRTTVYALMKAGELRPVHIGRSCRLSRAELERYVRHLEGAGPVPPRPRVRKRTSTDQCELFELIADPAERPGAR